MQKLNSIESSAVQKLESNSKTMCEKCSKIASKKILEPNLLHLVDLVRSFPIVAKFGVDTAENESPLKFGLPACPGTCLHPREPVLLPRPSSLPFFLPPLVVSGTGSGSGVVSGSGARAASFLRLLGNKADGTAGRMAAVARVAYPASEAHA